MRKITHLFLLCALVLVSTFTAKAQTAVVYQTSTAPSDGQFAADTHWFTINLRNTFLSVENVDESEYFYSGNGFKTIDNTIDKGLWCVVGDETNGYKFYNKSVGASKVLGINYVNGNSGGDARAKMVDATLENATTQGAENWLTTFNIHQNTTSNVGGFTLSVKGLTDYYLNQRSPYLAFWTYSGALEEIGSTFYFYNVESYVQQATELANTYTDKVGGVFQPTADELSAFKNQLNGYTWDNIKTLSTNVENFKSAIDAHKPEINKRYLLKNGYTQKVIVPNPMAGSSLFVYSGDDNLSKSAVWNFEDGDTEGTYKIRNAYSGLYINGTTADNDGSDFIIGTRGTYNGTIAMGTGNNTDHTWLHANTNDGKIVLWSAAAGASRWEIREVEDSEFITLEAFKPASALNDMVSAACDFLNAAPTEKAAFMKNPSPEKYKIYKDKVKEGTDNQYVRLQCAKNGNDKFMGLSDDYSKVNALDKSGKETNLSNIWKLVPVEGETGYKLQNANTGTYLTSIPDATTDNAGTATLTEFDNGYMFTFSMKNSTKGCWNVIDGNNNKLNAENDGRINYWTSDYNDGWWILKATDIQVALNALGEASYASVYLPFSISSVDGADAYVANSSAENNTLVMQTTADGGFAANAGVVLVSDTQAATATLTLGENTNTSLLSGTNTPVSFTDETRANYLVFGPKDGATNTVGFWTPASTLSSIAANRAYYQNTNGQAVALKFEGAIIEDIANVTAEADASAPVYDLTGRRVSNTLKGGVYIQNGKKFIVK